MRWNICMKNSVNSLSREKMPNCKEYSCWKLWSDIFHHSWLAGSFIQWEKPSLELHSNIAISIPQLIYTHRAWDKQVHLRYPSVYKPRPSIKFRLSSYRILYTATLKPRMLLGYIYITIALRNNLVQRKPFMAEIMKECQTYADRRFLKSTCFLRAFFKMIK